VKVPARIPRPGKFTTLTDTVSDFGADPLVGVTANQAPPSAVLVVAVKLNVPAPPFLTKSVCGVAALPDCTEKLNPPGKLSKNAPEAATVNVTEMVIERPGLANSVIIISPVYVPAARVLAFTLAVTANGVKQQALPVGEMLNHTPPFAVTALALKRIVDSSVVEMLRTCGSAFAPPNGMVKLIGFICVNAAVPTVTVTGIVVVSFAVWKTN
jgi:hypothetical protein